MSKSVIAFPAGSKIGFESTSILELLTGGNEEPGFTGVSLPLGSNLTTAAWLTIGAATASDIEALLDVNLASLFRKG